MSNIQQDKKQELFEPIQTISFELDENAGVQRILIDDIRLIDLLSNEQMDSVISFG